MGINRDKIKQMAEDIRAVETLEKLLNDGFIGQIDRFGSSPSSNEFKVNEEFQYGCGIEGSINQRMMAAQRRGIEKLENELRLEAEEIIKDYA